MSATDLVFVFRVFNKVSYALVMQTRLPVQIVWIAPIHSDKSEWPLKHSLKAWLALSLTRGLGGESARRLLKQFGSPDAVFAASINSLRSVVKPDVAAEIGKGID